MNHKSKTDFVYEVLKKNIFEGKWKPGQRRNADEIAKALRVSRTPVISAGKLLETEGLLRIIPQVGMEVPHLTKEGIEETFHIRGVLSGLATALACRSINEKGLKRLGDLVKLMDRCVPKRDYKRFSKLNREFHYTIFKNCGMPHVLMLLSRYWDSGSRYAKFFDYLPGVMASSAESHREILEALRKRDEAVARFAAEKDSLDFGLAIAKFLTESGVASANPSNASNIFVKTRSPTFAKKP